MAPTEETHTQAFSTQHSALSQNHPGPSLAEC